MNIFVKFYDYTLHKLFFFFFFFFGGGGGGGYNNNSCPLQHNLIIVHVNIVLNVNFEGEKFRKMITSLK